MADQRLFCSSAISGFTGANLGGVELDYTGYTYDHEQVLVEVIEV